MLGDIMSKICMDAINLSSVTSSAALPEWLRGMPAKCMRKRAKVRTLQAATFFGPLFCFGLWLRTQLVPLVSMPAHNLNSFVLL